MLASVLSNCESGSGASLGAPLVGDPSDRVPTALHPLAGGGDREV